MQCLPPVIAIKNKWFVSYEAIEAARFNETKGAVMFPATIFSTNEIIEILNLHPRISKNSLFSR
jgi:hypothetical protein